MKEAQRRCLARMSRKGCRRNGGPILNAEFALGEVVLLSGTAAGQAASVLCRRDGVVGDRAPARQRPESSCNHRSCSRCVERHPLCHRRGKGSSGASNYCRPQHRCRFCLPGSCHDVGQLDLKPPARARITGGSICPPAGCLSAAAREPSAKPKKCPSWGPRPLLWRPLLCGLTTCEPAQTRARKRRHGRPHEVSERRRKLIPRHGFTSMSNEPGRSAWQYPDKPAATHRR